MIYLVTGNHNKLKELRQVFPAEVELESIKLELDEIQTLDSHELVRHKLRQAYENLGKPVIVEDVSAELANLNGLPGPFIKFFEQRLGQEALYVLGGEGTAVKIVCTMGYFDGTREIIVDGVLNGVVTAPRGEHGFGFDSVVVPEGYDKTCAELGDDIKNTLSHRHHAALLMAERLKSQILV